MNKQSTDGYNCISLSHGHFCCSGKRSNIILRNQKPWCAPVGLFNPS